MEGKKICYKCLLEDFDEKGTFKAVQEMIKNIPAEDRTDEKEYLRRLSICRECESLVSGTCKKCGCYVELRAAGALRECPDAVNRWK